MPRSPRPASKSDPAAAEAGERNGAYAAPALKKGLDILEQLAGAADGLSQAQIAQGLGRSVSEIYRMLACLVDEGFVYRKRPGDRYYLSLKLFDLAHRHPPINRLISEALPVMRRLAATTGQSCHLAVRNGENILIIAQVDAPGPMGFAVRLGAQLPLLDTGSGRVFLAYPRSGLLGYGADQPSLPAGELDPHQQKRVREIARRGVEVAPSGFTIGITDLSAPVLDISGACIAALTIPFVDRIGMPLPPEGATEELICAALEISTAVGGPVTGG